MTITQNDRKATLEGRVRAARLIAGIDQADAAIALGVARQTLSNWERGVATIPADKLIALSDLTRVSLEWIARGDVRPEGFEPPTYCSGVNDPDKCCFFCRGDESTTHLACRCHDDDEPSALTLRSALGLAA